MILQVLVLFLLQLISISNIHKYIHAYIHAFNIHISINACIHAYIQMDTCRHTHIHVYLCADINTCMHTILVIYICVIWTIRLEEEVRTKKEAVAMYQDSLNRHKNELKTTIDGWSFVLSFINLEVLTCNMLLQCAVMFCIINASHHYIIQCIQWHPTTHSIEYLCFVKSWFVTCEIAFSHIIA